MDTQKKAAEYLTINLQFKCQGVLVCMGDNTTVIKCDK